MPQTFCFLVRLGNPYGQVVRGKSIRNHPLAIRLIRAVYGRPGVFGPHGRKISQVYPTDSVRSIRVREEIQAWKRPHDQSAGLYGAHKRPV